MDRLDRMSLFVRIVERGSFAAAAHDLGLGRSAATEAIKQLERDLGTRILERTTRHVAPTLEGQAFYERCAAILADIEEAESGAASAEPRGLLRVDAHPMLTQTFLLPRLDDFLARHPRLNLHLGQGDRYVDLVREGVDCVIRAGEVGESGLIMRRLGMISEITCASPGYLARHGMPSSWDALEGHAMIGFLSSRTGEVIPLEFMVEGRPRYVTLPARLTVNNSDTLKELARQGHGLIQVPRYRLAEDLAAGRLVEVLPQTPPSPTPLSLFYPQNRHTSPRLRVFIDWVVEVFSKAEI